MSLELLTKLYRVFLCSVDRLALWFCFLLDTSQSSSVLLIYTDSQLITICVETLAFLVGDVFPILSISSSIMTESPN